MALTDSSPVIAHPEVEARGQAGISASDPSPGTHSLVHSLARLPCLHDEARLDLQALALLERSPRAALILMVSGAIVLAGGWTSLRAAFAWSLLVLAGVIGIVRNFIRGFAVARRTPARQAGAALWTLLVFCGIAWGSGAFLVLPPAPSMALAAAFALLPGLAMSLALKDRKGAICFAMPAAAITAAAIQAQLGPPMGPAMFAVPALAGAIALLTGPHRARSPFDRYTHLKR
ncbi:MAG TPA: hypothetical protein VFS01_12925 [Rhizomicrobium sp.]|nr:hypothetical protein [Rhizomicrobium sp.]